MKSHKLSVISEYIPLKQKFQDHHIWESGRYKEARAFLCLECGKIFTFDVRSYKEGGKVYDFGECDFEERQPIGDEMEPLVIPLGELDKSKKKKGRPRNEKDN